jgi:hypothetical protein
MHLGADGGEGAGVLAADYPRADDDDRLRQFPDGENLVRVVDARILEREVGRTSG